MNEVFYGSPVALNFEAPAGGGAPDAPIRVQLSPVGKHPGDAAMIPGVIAYGDVYEDDVNGKFYCIKKRNLVVLRKGNGRNHYLITGYAKEDAHAIAKIRKEHKLVEKGE